MNKYESLVDAAANAGADVVDYSFSSPRIKGLYHDGVIAISKQLKTTAEKSCVLAEELGHHETSSGDILDLTNAANRKQEYRARILAYEKMVGLMGIVSCHRAGCRNIYEMAEHLEVSEEFLVDALAYYHNKYGQHAEIDNYTIFFEPALAVLEKI